MKTENLRPIRIKDVFGTELKIRDYLVNVLTQMAENSNFQAIKTPLFEHKDLFVRSAGGTSDIVQKEIYAFSDKSGREMALRPELTAGVVRAVLENKLFLPGQKTPLKLFYCGDVFRYERPQAGRHREFTQFGGEIINSQLNDIFATLLDLKAVLTQLGVTDYRLEINYLPNEAALLSYLDGLKIYFSLYQDELSETSRQRLESNPLRILDDKIDGPKPIVKKAPKLSAYYAFEDNFRWGYILKMLKTLNIDFVVNENLVRGLDYYRGFVFEFISADGLTFCAGGEYTDLVGVVSDLIGLKTKVRANCFGYAFGLERLMRLFNQDLPTKQVDVLLLDLVDDGEMLVLQNAWKAAGLSVDYQQVGKLSAGWKLANNVKPRFVAIYGLDEASNGTLTLKRQTDGQQWTVPIDDALALIK